MDAQELKSRIARGTLSGAYLFAGEEDYLSKYYLGTLRDAIVTDAAFALFNHAVFDGAEVSLAEIAEAIKSPPMMSDRKLIEWRYPDIDRMRENERKGLEEIAAMTKEYPQAVFAVLTTPEGFDPGTGKRPSKTAARLGKVFSLLNFERSTDAQLLSWLKKHFESRGIRVDAQSLSALLFRTGHSMTVLANEVEKLADYLLANGQDTLTVAAVEAVASSTTECDAFALSNAVTEGNRQKAFLALYDMASRRVDPGAVLAMLERSFCDLVTVSLLLDEGHGAADVTDLLKWNAYKVKIHLAAAKRYGTARLSAALAALREADVASKSGGVSGYEPIELFLATRM